MCARAGEFHFSTRGCSGVEVQGGFSGDVIAEMTHWELEPLDAGELADELARERGALAAAVPAADRADDDDAAAACFWNDAPMPEAVDGDADEDDNAEQVGAAAAAAVAEAKSDGDGDAAAKEKEMKPLQAWHSYLGRRKEQVRMSNPSCAPSAHRPRRRVALVVAVAAARSEPSLPTAARRRRRRDVRERSPILAIAPRSHCLLP